MAERFTQGGSRTQPGACVNDRDHAQRFLEELATRAGADPGELFDAPWWLELATMLLEGCGRPAIVCAPARDGEQPQAWRRDVLVRFVDGERERVLVDAHLVEEADPVEVEASALPGKLRALVEDLDG